MNEMGTLYLATLFLSLAFHDRADCFLPYDVSVAMADSPDSRHHADITLEALDRIIDWFLNENKVIYPPSSHAKLKSTGTFKTARERFKTFVGKHDSFPPADKDPSYHFTAEKFVESNQRMVHEREKVINAIKVRNFVVARTFAGSLFHTLQDFYSSSNWVEMGNQMIKENLGSTSAFDDSIFATPGEKTCDNCQIIGECRRNIKSNILEEKRLTSGYFSKHDVDKPEGKCGYGGKEDTFRRKDATGGINKDTKNNQYSPHHYLHQQAANMAVDSTVDMLTGIYQATIDNRESFGEFLGIELFGSLCFVIDTTGSMGDEIADVINLTIQMTKDSEGSGMNYVLVPVNDPAPDIINTTSDPNEMIKLLVGLVADGGGDMPEMSMSGMLLAAQNVRPGSKCYVFTDAEAKDKHLKETLISVSNLRNVKFEFKLTKIMGKRKRSTRFKRSLLDDYREIAEASGGSIVLVRKEELREILKVVEIESKISSVYVSYGYLRNISQFEYYVDSTLNETYIEVSVIGSNIGEVSITSPTGVITNAEVVSRVQNSRLYKIVNPENGKWSASVTLSTPGIHYTYRVFCASSIDFTYTLMSDVGVPIESSPIRGKEYYVSLGMFGAVDKESLKLLIISINGSTLNEVKVNHSSSNFIAKSALPLSDEGFFIAIEGRDDKGIPFTRVNSNMIKTSHVTLELALEETEGLDIKPGASIQVKIKLSNMGTNLFRWSLKIFDSNQFLTGAKNMNFEVTTNKSEIFVLDLTAPKTSTPGQVSTVSLSVSSETDSAVKNSLVFYVSVIPEESDLKSPTCKVMNINETICKNVRAAQCSFTHWTASVVVRDLESGLKIFKLTSSHPGANFSSDEFVKGTQDEVRGMYQSSCCHPNVTIVAVDDNGNVGRCQLKVVSSSYKAVFDFRCFLFVILFYFLFFW